MPPPQRRPPVRAEDERDARASTSSKLQKRTAGPTRGPPAKRSHSSPGTAIVVVALTLGAPRSIAGAAEERRREARRLAPRERDRLRARDDGDGDGAALAGGSAASPPLIESDSSCASGGSVIVCSPSAARAHVERERHVGRAEARLDLGRALVDGERLPGARRRGARARRSLARPATGATRARAPRRPAGVCTNGMPENDACQIGPHVDAPHLDPRERLRRRRAPPATSARAPSASETSVACGAEVDQRLAALDADVGGGHALARQERHLERRSRRPSGRHAHDARVDLPVEARAERPLDPHERRQRRGAASAAPAPPPSSTHRA